MGRTATSGRVSKRAVEHPDQPDGPRPHQKGTVARHRRHRLAALDTATAHRQYFETRDTEVRTLLLERYQALAYSLATRYAKRPEDADELGQVTLLGLLRAIDRFDPTRGVQFSTFAWATLRGEIKRYYRNHSWQLRVPRGLQERYLAVAAALDELSHELGRSPTYPEIAAHCRLTEDEVAEAIEVRGAHRVASLDAPVRDGSDQMFVLGDDDRALDAVERRRALDPLLRRLPAREQRIVRLRFVDELTQAEIAARVQLSQMHVSRLLAQSLARLREWAAEAPDLDD